MFLPISVSCPILEVEIPQMVHDQDIPSIEVAVAFLPYALHDLLLRIRLVSVASEGEDGLFRVYLA